MYRRTGLPVSLEARSGLHSVLLMLFFASYVYMHSAGLVAIIHAQILLQYPWRFRADLCTLTLATSLPVESPPCTPRSRSHHTMLEASPDFGLLCPAAALLLLVLSVDGRATPSLEASK